MSDDRPPLDAREAVAFRVMTLEIAQTILARADQPADVARYITDEVRELTGGRTVLLLQCAESGTRPQLLHACPERRRDLASCSEIDELAPLIHALEAPTIWRGAEEPGRLGHLLGALEAGDSIAVPLSIGVMRVGFLLILGIPSEAHTRGLLEALQTLSTLVALVLRSAALFRNQEAVIAERTSQFLESERSFRSVLETVSLLSVMLDPSGRIILCNDFLLRLTGWQRQEVLGGNWFERFLPPEIRDGVEQGVFLKMIQAGEFPAHYENEILTRSGERRLVAWNNTVIRDHHGAVVSVASIGEDITARKRAEDALRESEAKLSALFASMTEMVVLHDLVFDEAGKPVNYRITDCNAAYTSITGIRREDAVGRLATEVYGTPEPPYLKEYAGVGLTGEPHQYETYFPPMGKHFSISVVSPGANRFATITTDVSEARRIQTVIDAKNKELEQLVYVASHDLRSPLVNVDGFSRELDYSLKDLTALLDGGTDAGALEKALRTEIPGMEKSIGRIRTSAAQMDKLLTGLLHLSRQGRASLHIEDVDMNDCLARLAES